MRSAVDVSSDGQYEQSLTYISLNIYEVLIVTSYDMYCYSVVNNNIYTLTYIYIYISLNIHGECLMIYMSQL